MNFTCKILLILLWCSGIRSNAQNLPSERYTSKTGLIADRITAITQDENGYMWFGSYFGIGKYDGNKFEKINLPPEQQNKYVRSLLPAYGSIYATFLFGGGLAEYSKGKLHSYYLKGKDSISINQFTALLNIGNRSLLLANYNNELYVFREGLFRKIISLPLKNEDKINCLQKDQFNTIWIGTESGLFLLPYPYSNLVKLHEGSNIFQLQVDNEKNIWIALKKESNTIVQKCSGWNRKLMNYQTIKTIANTLLVPYSASSENGLWLVNNYGKLINLDYQSNCKYYDSGLDLATDVNCIFTDREKNLWIANEPGVLKITNLHIQTFLFKEIAAAGGSLSIYSDSCFYISNSKSLYFISKKGLFEKASDLRNGINDLYGNIHKDNADNLWIGLWNGGIWSSKWKDGKVYKKHFYLKYHENLIKCSAIAEDHYGNIWVAGFNGIFHFKNGAVVDEFHPLNKSGSRSFITCLVINEANQTIWCGDNNSGVIKIKYSFLKDSSISYRTIQYAGNNEGLKDTYVRALALDRNKNLWIGTRYGGIYKLIDADDSKISVLNYNSEANISCSRISNIISEDSSALWFATCDGIYRYGYNAHSWKHYTISDGLLNSEVFNIAIDKSNKNILVLSSQGISKFPINNIEYSIPPLISISSISILGQVDSTAQFTKGPTKYNYNQNSIGFSFTAPSFIDEKKVMYKYKLDGWNKTWSEPTLSNSITFASLPEGKYRFEVQASNAKGQWSNPAVFEFIIVMPFYKQPWFLFSVLLLVILIVYGIRIQRLKQKFKIEKLRFSIARDLHDDIGSALGSINILSKTASRKLEGQNTHQEVTPIFQRIGQSAENTLEAMDDIVWSINPEKDRMEDMIIRMREFIIPLMESNNIDLSFNVSANMEQSIPMNLRKNVFLIFKEVVHNIIKHANATIVSIEINQNTEHLSLKISDNGKGFDLDIPTGRNGLKNLYARASMVNGVINIVSKDSGTTVYFTVPVR